MNNLNSISKQKVELIKELTDKQIRLAVLNLWEKYYTSIIKEMNIKKANNYIKQFEFIVKNVNMDEWSKVDKKDLAYNIELIPTTIGIELKYDIISISKNLNNMILFSIYQKLQTFNKMFSIVKDSLNTLDNNQSIDLATEIIGCEMLITRANRVNENIPQLKPDKKTYNNYLKEKETFIKTMDSTTFSEDIHKYMEIFKNKVNKKLAEKKN